MNTNNIRTVLVTLGIPSAAATVVQQLLISAPYTQSHTTLHEQTNLSKAAISNSLQYLEALDAITYKADDTGRRQVIEFHVASLVEYIKRRMLTFNQLATELHILAQSQNDDEFSSGIESVASVCDTLDSVVWQTITAWEGKHAKKRQNT